MVPPLPRIDSRLCRSTGRALAIVYSCVRARKISRGAEGRVGEEVTAHKYLCQAGNLEEERGTRAEPLTVMGLTGASHCAHEEGWNVRHKPVWMPLARRTCSDATYPHVGRRLR